MRLDTIGKVYGGRCWETQDVLEVVRNVLIQVKRQDLEGKLIDWNRPPVGSQPRNLRFLMTFCDWRMGVRRGERLVTSDILSTKLSLLS
jgi:hypothetical protein